MPDPVSRVVLMLDTILQSELFCRLLEVCDPRVLYCPGQGYLSPLISPQDRVKIGRIEDALAFHYLECLQVNL